MKPFCRGDLAGTHGKPLSKPDHRRRDSLAPALTRQRKKKGKLEEKVSSDRVDAICSYLEPELEGMFAGTMQSNRTALPSIE